MPENYIIDIRMSLPDLVSLYRGANMTGDSYFVRRFIDEWYFKLSEELRLNLFETVVEQIYGKCFTANPSLNGTDKLFLARYNPNTQVEVKYSTADGKLDIVKAFTSEGQYYLSSYETIPKDVIVNVEYL